MATPHSAATYNPADSRASSLKAAEITTFVLAVVAVSLRFLSRHMRKASYWLDDWLLLSSLVPAAGFLSNVLIWIPKGLGGHYVFFGPQVFYNFNKFLFIGELEYTLVLVLVKYGILALYWRIFDRRAMRISVIATASVVTSWGVAVIVTCCLQCVPIQGFWDKSIESTCHVDTNKFFMGVTISNILTDGWLLALPVPFVLHLQTTNSQKIWLSGMFFLGGFVTVASILRLVSVAQDDPNDPDVTWTFAVVGVWSAAEINIAIVSANLPCLAPIYTYLLKGILAPALESVKGLSSWRRRNTEDIELRSTSTDSGRRPNGYVKALGRKGVAAHYETLDEESSIPIRITESHNIYPPGKDPATGQNENKNSF